MYIYLEEKNDISIDFTSFCLVTQPTSYLETGRLEKEHGPRRQADTLEGQMDGLCSCW